MLLCLPSLDLKNLDNESRGIKLGYAIGLGVVNTVATTVVGLFLTLFSPLVIINSIYRIFFHPQLKSKGLRSFALNTIMVFCFETLLLLIPVIGFIMHSALYYINGWGCNRKWSCLDQFVYYSCNPYAFAATAVSMTLYGFSGKDYKGLDNIKK